MSGVQFDLFPTGLRITERVAAAIGEATGALRRIDERCVRAKAPEHLSSYEYTMFYDDLYARPDVQDRVRSCI